MIPIECPKCGRGGSVPPDRLNARLVCKACHTVFHLDNTGRMVLGEPQSFDMKSTKSKASEVSSIADFDFAQTWNDIPKPVKFGVPALLLALLGYLYIDFGSGTPDYLGNSQAILQAAADNNKSKVVSYATADSADAAGQWCELVHGEFQKNDLSTNLMINPALFSGNAEVDTDIMLLVVVTKADGTGSPVTVTMPMKKDGSSWKFEGNKGLEDAAKQAQSSKTKK